MKSFFTHYSKICFYCSFAIIALILQACVVSGGGGLQNSGGTSKNKTLTLVTNDPILQSDQIFVQNTMSAPQIILDDGQLAWDNVTTGSQGMISDYKESRLNGQLCRNFQIERTAFNGVSLFKGQVCQIDNGTWQLTQFDLIQ